MKKELKNITDLSDVKRARKSVRNALEEGTKAEVAAAIDALFAKLEELEINLGEDEAVGALKSEFMTKIEETEGKLSESQKTAVTEMIHKIINKAEAIKPAAFKDLPDEVKNSVFAAVLRCGGKDRIQTAITDSLVRNGITGVTFADVIDYRIVEDWGSSDPLFSQLKKAAFNKWFYSTQTFTDPDIMAKEWTKTNEGEKLIQDIEADGKTINHKYIYKRQQFANEDLDRYERAGALSEVMRFTVEELGRQLVNTIVMAILIGDTVNESADRITTFETIGNKTVSDVWTTVVERGYSDDVTPVAEEMIAALRRTADAVKNPFSKKKVLLISTATKTAAATSKYGEGGSTYFRGDAELASMLGVDQIITTDFLAGEGRPLAIAMIPDGYWVYEEKALNLAYPTYEKNVQNYQVERNIGGAIHDLYSTAVLVEPDED